MTSGFTALGLLIATIYAFQNLLRYAKAKDWNGTAGILIAAVSGIGAVVLAAHGSVTTGVHLFQQGTVIGPALGSLNGADQVMLGIAVGSGGSVLADLRKAIDATDTASKPSLVAVPDPAPAAVAA